MPFLLDFKSLQSDSWKSRRKDKQDRFKTCFKTCGSGPLVLAPGGWVQSHLAPGLGRQTGRWTGKAVPLAPLETYLGSIQWDLEAKTAIVQTFHLILIVLLNL